MRRLTYWPLSYVPFTSSTTPDFGTRSWLSDGRKASHCRISESILSRKIDDLEPTLARHGYRLKDMVEQFDAKPTEIRALFSNQLYHARETELRDRMLLAGPI